MSEVEIMEQIKNDLNVGEFYGITEEAIKGLLDLYNKQKEEIRRLKQNTMVLAKELDEQQEEINSLEEELELGNAITKAQFVSKDKIREIIESSSYPDFAIQKLEELLEEN